MFPQNGVITGCPVMKAGIIAAVGLNAIQEN